MNLATEIEFFTHIINLEKLLKDGYVLSITRTWNDCYVVTVMDTTICEGGFEEDPSVMQQTSPFSFLEVRGGVQDEVDRLYRRLKSKNLLKMTN